jgi:hypothetical protein
VLRFLRITTCPLWYSQYQSLDDTLDTASVFKKTPANERLFFHEADSTALLGQKFSMQNENREVDL